MIEIERKFLVTSDAFKIEATKQATFEQGYLNTDPARSVRIRLVDEKAILTIKGASSNNGLSRFEWETEIPLKEGKALLSLCEPGMISKTRYFVPAGPHIFEVDIFQGENAGLILAEIELGSEHENYHRPEWLGREVTGDARYYNSALSKKPFKTWTL